ncbi:globoside alpha-1,3-N-acetylgalactosaminyltransferase 1-like [Osmerus eperlanus]|uniref:globoside alpha-1,3-N-acetylgalactosaminyltransferase 1-like n=1 Tax=Osmerus eperlanus TaxID=29151 RepID=UPI002E11236E
MLGFTPNMKLYSLCVTGGLLLFVYACFYSESIRPVLHDLGIINRKSDIFNDNDAKDNTTCGLLLLRTLSSHHPSKTQNKVLPQGLLYKKPSVVSGRTDVVSVTPWMAPIVWDEVFDSVVLDSIYKKMDITIATTVFALGKYVLFLKDFLHTAEKHYMVGYKVDYYIFTDRPGDVPNVTLAEGRRVRVLKVPSSNRWQEISARRMEMIQTTIESTIRGHADYIFCLDVDSKFHAHFGVEALGRLVATIHPGYYATERGSLPYERRPESRAYIPFGEGDFYYGGAVFGGLLEDVRTMAEICRRNFEADTANGIEAAWQEESHLNRYFTYNKPSKLLSPEYLWQDVAGRSKHVKIIRFSGVAKNYADFRPN